MIHSALSNHRASEQVRICSQYMNHAIYSLLFQWLCVCDRMMFLGVVNDSYECVTVRRCGGGGCQLLDDWLMNSKYLSCLRCGMTQVQGE